MRKTLNVLLAALLALGTCGCGNSEPVSQQNETETVNEGTGETAAETEEPVIPEDEMIDDPAWDTLASLGKVETENGLFFVSVTLPADLVGSDISQEDIDASAGETYTSGRLNEDGSVTYRMSKKQHRAMLDNLSASFDEALDEIVNSGDYAVSEISHNSDFTQFDVTLSSDELGLAESFLVMGFYMYGGMYSLFSGKESPVIVNFYNAAGELINTANSADFEN